MTTTALCALCGLDCETDTALILHAADTHHLEPDQYQRTVETMKTAALGAAIGNRDTRPSHSGLLVAKDRTPGGYL